MGDTLTVAIAGTPVMVREGTFRWDDQMEQRSNLTFTVRDDNNSLSIPFGALVTVTSAAYGLLYSGIVWDDIDTNDGYPGTLHFHQVTCADNHWFADKLYFKQNDYKSLNAGTIICDLLNAYLLAEGIQANFAYRADNILAQMSQGTLTNVVAASTVSTGDLELAPSGTEVTQTESGTAFNTGTINGVSLLNNQMVPNYQNCLHLQGTSMSGANNGNNYVYIKIGAYGIQINAGTYLGYGVWISSKSPQIMAGVDLIFTDGTALRNIQSLDQNGLGSHPATDLSGYATDRRYYRSIDLTPVVGKVIASVQVAFEGNNAGTYDAYFDTITLYGGTSQNFYINGSPPLNSALSNIGYANVSLVPGILEFTGYNNYGQRISPAYSLAGAGIAKSSVISWVQDFYPANPYATTTQTTTGTRNSTVTPTQGPNKIDYAVIETSLDGGVTWQKCTNHQPIPNLLPGMNLTGISLQMRQTLYIAGYDPTATPTLISVTFVVQPSYVATKTDMNYSDTAFTSGSGANAQWYAGDSTVPGGLQISGAYRNFDAEFGDGINNMTQWGANPVLQSTTGSATIRCDGSNQNGIARCDFAGQWQNMTIECDVLIPDTVGNYGITYRTTNWGNTNDTYAYSAFIGYTGIGLAKGTNSSGTTGGYTQLSIANVVLQTSQWYHLTIVVNGSSHKVYLDGVLYINVTDSTYTASGYIGLRHYNDTTVRHSGYFRNFGVNTSNFTGTHTSPSQSLNSVGTVGNSYIAWNASVPSNTSLTIQTSIDGGSTWQTCANNAAIPNLTVGTSVAGKSIQYKATLTTGNANATPSLESIAISVQGQFNASGSRVSPAISLAGVGRAGSATVSWAATLPTNTTLLVDTSTDGSTYTNVGSGASGSAAIADVTTQPLPTYDVFATNTLANYTAATMTGGTAASWSYDATNFRVIAAGGSGALFLANALTGLADVDFLFDTDYCDSAGVAWRHVDANNSYELVISDASAPGGGTTTIYVPRVFGGTIKYTASSGVGTPNTATLYKVASGVRTKIVQTAISFVRSTYHRFRVTMLAGVVTVQMDGIQIISYTDGSPLAGGGIGFYSDGGTAHFYQLWVQPQGQIFSGGASVYSRIRLTSIDPTVTPLVTQVSVAVTDPSIGAGAFVDSTNYKNTNTIAQCIDDLAKRSNYTWKINKNKKLYFNLRESTPAAWIVQSVNDPDLSNPISTCRANTVSIETMGPTYRNQSVIVGGKDITSLQTETRVGDDNTQAWAMAYPLASVPIVTTYNPAISQDGIIATVGILHVDTGRQYYYQPGSNIISQDKTLAALTPTQTITFAYYGQIDVVQTYADGTEQANFKAIEGGSGIVEVAESVPTLSSAAALALATSRVQQNEVRGKTLKFQTGKSGLAIGQVVPVFLPQYKQTNQQFLISKVSMIPYQLGDGTLNTWYSVEGVQGPVLKHWSSVFVNSD